MEIDAFMQTVGAWLFSQVGLHVHTHIHIYAQGTLTVSDETHPQHRSTP